MRSKFLGSECSHFGKMFVEALHQGVYCERNVIKTFTACGPGTDERLSKAFLNKLVIKADFFIRLLINYLSHQTQKFLLAVWTNCRRMSLSCEKQRLCREIKFRKKSVIFSHKK